jgi:hypothetical protein
MGDELVQAGPFKVERNVMWALPSGAILLTVTVLVYAYLVYQRSSSGLPCGSAWQMKAALAEASALGAALLAVTLSAKLWVQVLLALVTLAVAGLLGYYVAHLLYAPQCGY